MTDELSFPITAEDKASASIGKVGKSSAAAAIQIEAANLKVEKSAKSLAAAEEKYGKGSLQAREAANKLAAANLKLASSMAKTEEASEDAEKGVSKLHATLGALGAAGVAAGAAAAISKSLDIRAGTKKLQAQLGATGPEAARLGKVAGDLYAGNFGDSMENVDDAIKNVEQNIGHLGDSGANSLQNITGQVLSLAQGFDVDLFDATKAVGTLMRSGLAPDASYALDLITTGLQKIPGAAEDLLDTFTEYSVQFKALGLNGNQVLAFIGSAMQGGARNTDLAADALKEFNLRAKDTTNTGAQNALDELGLSATKAAGAIAGGGSSAANALADILARLEAVQNPTDRARLATALFGTQAEDLQQALLKVDPTVFTKGLDGVTGSAQRFSDTIGDTEQGKIESYKRQLEQLATGAASLPGPLGSAAAIVVGFSGTALAAGANIAQLGGGLAVIPGVANAATAATLRLRGALLTLGPAIAVVGTAVAAVELGQYIGTTTVATVSSQKLSAALEELGASGKLGAEGLDLFENRGVFGLISNDADDTTDALERFGRQAERALGTGLSQKAGRALNFGKSVGQLADTTKQLDASFTALVRGGHIDEASAAQAKFVQAAKDAGVPVEKLSGLFPQYNAAIKDAVQHQKDAAAAAAVMGKGLDDVSGSAKNATLTQQELNEATATYSSQILSLRGDARAYEQAIDDATEAAKTNGKTLDITTEKGRANAAALDQIASAGLALAQQTPKGANAQEYFAKTLARTRSNLIAAAEKMGLTKKAAQELATKILGVPSTKRIRFTDNTADLKKRISSTQSSINKLHGKTITISIREIVSRRGKGSGDHDSTIFAAGGPVRGPGTSTSDSIPAFLSNGEHVISAAEVQKLGGHAMIEKLRKGLIPSQVVPVASSLGGGGGVANVVLQINSSGSAVDDFLVQVLRKAVRVKGGGNVQVALGRN